MKKNYPKKEVNNMAKAKPAYKTSLMTAKEHKASMKEFNKRPGEMEKLKKIKEKNKRYK